MCPNYGISAVFSSKGSSRNIGSYCVIKRCGRQAAVVKNWLNRSHFPESFKCLCYQRGWLSIIIKQLEYVYDPSAGNGENRLTSLLYAFAENNYSA